MAQNHNQEQTVMESTHLFRARQFYVHSWCMCVHTRVFIHCNFVTSADGCDPHPHQYTEEFSHRDLSGYAFVG